MNRQAVGTLDEHKKLQVPCGPITRARAKRIREAMQGLTKRLFDQELKEGVYTMGLDLNDNVRLVNLIHAKDQKE